MARKLFDNVRHLIATPGAGAIVLGTVPATWQGFAAAGAVDGDNPPYELVDGDARENGYLTLADGVTTATRTVVTSTNGGDPIELTGNAVLTCTPIAGTFNDDLLSVSRSQGLSSGAQAQGRSNLGATTTGSALMTAVNAADARDTIGATTVGEKLITATDAAAARAVVGSFGKPQGRLTLATGDPAPVADQTAKTTIYYTAAVGSGIPVYDGTALYVKTFSADLSLALDGNSGHSQYASSGNTYDLFAAVVGGTFYFGHGPAWTSDSTRNAALSRSAIHGLLVNAATMSLRYGNGAGDTVSVPSGQATWLGIFRSTANGQTEDSVTKRFLANAYNPVQRCLVAAISANVTTIDTGFNARAAALKLEYLSIAAHGAVTFTQNLVVSASSAAGRVESYLRSDGTTIEEGFGAATSANSNDISCFANGFARTIADGYHYVETLQRTNTGGGTLWGDTMGSRRSSIRGCVNI